MGNADDFAGDIEGLLEGRYDCVDRISLNGYFPMGCTSGGLLTWWNALSGGESLDEQKLRAFAGTFSRRVRTWAERNNVPLVDCATGDKTKHAQAERLQPKDPAFRGVFAIFVARAPAPVWEAYTNDRGKVVLYRTKGTSLVNHYYFHIVDEQWGHITIRLCGHPPFAALIMLNGHEWAERMADRQGVAFVKRSNCFVEGSDLEALDRIGSRLRADRVFLGLAGVCEKWIYSACLCFGLTREEQQRSGFRYQYSCYQIEYSRNLVFRSGRELDEFYQNLVERTWPLLDVPRLKTIFGRRNRPHLNAGRRIEKRIDQSDHDLTVLKVKFGRLELKMYDKGARVLRLEMVARHVDDLRCGRQLLRAAEMIACMRQMLLNFYQVVQAVCHCCVGARQLDRLPAPSQCGSKRIAGVDLQKPRMQAVAEAVIGLAAAPCGFTVEELSEHARRHCSGSKCCCNHRQAAYELRKLRAKGLVERVPEKRRYRVRKRAIQTLAGYLILREKVIKPVLGGAGAPKPGRPHNCASPIDQHYEILQQQMYATLKHLNLLAA